MIYALLIGHFMYGGLGLRKLYGMLVETAALSRRGAAGAGRGIGDGLGHHAERRRAAAVAVPHHAARRRDRLHGA